MRARGSVPAWWLALALLLVAGGTVVIAAGAWNDRLAAFETDARIAHRLLSQRAVQHDTILATLALLQPAGATADAPEQRLPALYPQVLQVLRRDREATWPGDAAEVAALVAGEAASRAARRPAAAGVDLSRGRYLLVLAADPASFALRIDIAAMVPRSEWPYAADGQALVALELAGQRWPLTAATLPDTRWRFDFRKHLAADSQPFDLVAAQVMPLAAWPWAGGAAWTALVLLALAGAAAWQGQRDERRRAQDLLRLGQVGRLNALGELAAGMAHELNQPLTALMASAQAADRLLADDPPDIPTARHAMRQAVQQARRSADVVGRLRRVVERPGLGDSLQALPVDAALRSALDLLAPECRRLGVVPELRCDPSTVAVRAEPVALEQILHNLLSNALHALGQVPMAERRLTVSARAEPVGVVLDVLDSGPGIAADALPRLFEPFFSTRPGGLGLGLSLCETLAAGMGGALSASNLQPRGAGFRLTLPRAGGDAGGEGA